LYFVVLIAVACSYCLRGPISIEKVILIVILIVTVPLSNTNCKCSSNCKRNRDHYDL